MSGKTPRLRVIDSGPGDAAWNMALDEAISESVREGGVPPTLRLYSWSARAVTIGRFQSADDVDLSFCMCEGIDIVRRPTGGRAILHGDELTYSFSAPAGFGGLGGGLHSDYSRLSAAFVHAFESLGLSASNGLRRNPPPGGGPLCFGSASFGELTIGGKKVIGSAQRRWPGGFLQQGSIPLRLDRGSMQRVFRVNGSAGLEDKMAGLSEVGGPEGLEELKEAVREGFLQALALEAESRSPEKREVCRARELVREKYGSPEWNLLKKP